MDDYLDEQLQVEEFKKAFDNMQPELDAIRVMADAGISKKHRQKNIKTKEIS